MRKTFPLLTAIALASLHPPAIAGEYVPFCYVDWGQGRINLEELCRMGRVQQKPQSTGASDAVSSYRQLRNGMTRTEVEAIMGGPGEGPRGIVTYKFPPIGSITIRYSANDSVTSFAGLDEEGRGLSGVAN